MKIYIRNNIFKSYDNDVRALVGSFYPGAEPVFLGRDGSDASACAENTGNEPKDRAVCIETKTGIQAEYAKRFEDRTVYAGPVYLSYKEAELIDIDAIADTIERNPDRFEEKTNLKKRLYELLKDRTGRSLPWGTLTGIRPVRILEMLQERGKTAEEADKELRDRFLISDAKIGLMSDIEEREQRLLHAIDYKNGNSIYIGIPFCPTRCLYCSFTSNQISENDDRPDRYVECVCRELEALSCGRKDNEYTSFDRSGLKTLYIGGGTPTALNERQLEKLLDKVSELFGTPYEYTVEAGRPDSITREKLEIMKAHRVGRISVNPQTFNQKTLDLIGRKHTVEQTVWAYELARKTGFDNINMDLIMGLPGEDTKDVAHTLDMIRELKPDSLTVHALAVKRAARLSTEGKAWGGVERKGLSSDSIAADDIGQMIGMGAECAAELDMKPYYLYRQKNMAGNQDNVGYALPGAECLYNILMMEEKHTVYGVGAGASTKVVYTEKNKEKPELFKNRIVRYDNVKNLNDYLIYTF